MRAHPRLDKAENRAFVEGGSPPASVCQLGLFGWLCTPTPDSQLGQVLEGKPRLPPSLLAFVGAEEFSPHL